MESTSRKKLDSIDTCIFDIDGVFTDGNFIYTEEGKFAKIFGPHDADGIKILKRKGIRIQCVTADKRGFEITKKRIADDMGLPLELVSESDRLEWLNQNFTMSSCVYMGDGYHDIAIFKIAGYAVAPCNAFYLTRESADYVTKTPAGSGAVLDAVLHLLSDLN